MNGRSRWNAVVHVRPARAEHGLSPGAGGAYVSIFALAHDETNFREAVQAAMDELGLLAIEFDKVVTYDPDSEDWDNEEARELNDNLSDEWPVQYRTFHNYPIEDIDG